MSTFNSSVPIVGTLTPADLQDQYATHNAIYGKGGCMQVATISERNLIPPARRTVGMLVIVTNDVLYGANNIYTLVNGITNDDWISLFDSKYFNYRDNNTVIMAESAPLFRNDGSQLGAGDFWFDVETAALFIYYEGNNSSQWVQLTENRVAGLLGEWPNVNPVYPDGLVVATTPPWDNGSTSLTATGCIEMSIDNINFTQGPLVINDGQVLYTRWIDNIPCAKAVHDTTIEGRIKNEFYFKDGSLTLDRLPNAITFEDLTNQLVNSASTSLNQTVTGFNAHTKLWSPSSTSINPQISINSGFWVDIPTTFEEALTIDYRGNNQTSIKLRHTNNSTDDTDAATTIYIGYSEVGGAYISTTWTTTTAITVSEPDPGDGSTTPIAVIATPVITSPSNQAVGIEERPIITSSIYSAVNAGPHVVSDWQIYLKNSLVTPIYEALDDATNKVSITIPAGELTENTQYVVRVRYGDGFVKSDWSSYSNFTTGEFPPTLTISLLDVADRIGTTNFYAMHAPDRSFPSEYIPTPPNSEPSRLLILNGQITQYWSPNSFYGESYSTIQYPRDLGYENYIPNGFRLLTTRPTLWIDQREPSSERIYEELYFSEWNSYEFPWEGFSYYTGLDYPLTGIAGSPEGAQQGFLGLVGSNGGAVIWSDNNAYNGGVFYTSLSSWNDTHSGITPTSRPEIHYANGIFVAKNAVYLKNGSTYEYLPGIYIDTNNIQILSDNNSYVSSNRARSYNAKWFPGGEQVDETMGGEYFVSCSDSYTQSDSLYLSTNGINWWNTGIYCSKITPPIKLNNDWYVFAANQPHLASKPTNQYNCTLFLVDNTGTNWTTYEITPPNAYSFIQKDSFWIRSTDTVWLGLFDDFLRLSVTLG